MKTDMLQQYLYNAVENCGDRVAVYYKDRAMTYCELLHQSKRIGKMLVDYGVSDGMLVGIYMEKSDYTIAAMFGVMIAGGAYVPLDTVHSPIKRIVDIIENTELQIILISSSCWENMRSEIEHFEYLQRVTFIVVDDSKTEIYEQNLYLDISKRKTNDVGGMEASGKDSLAYVLFTSGSTGKPKGVMISHENAITFVEWCCSYFHPTQEDRFLSIAPFHFDLSVFDIYVTIASGASLFIATVEEERNLINYLRYIKEKQITYLYSVPSIWNAFLRFGKMNKGELNSLTHVLFAGELFEPKALRQTMEYVPLARFFNLYGLIETNVFTYYEVLSKDLVNDAPVPIGFVCDNSEAIILDGEREVTAVGEEGELCMCGPVLMKGYFNNQELTDKVMRSSPIEKHGGKVFFHTGDIVKLNEEGAYVLVGRNDFLIKKNGFRIELSEIEVALSSMDGVDEVAAVAIRDDQLKVTIYAAITVKDQNVPSVREMKELIAKKIPYYMVPDYIEIVEGFDRTANGKIDRELLKEKFSK